MTSQLVSVLMTSYNSESYLSKSIQSVLNQTHNHLELIIVDDCSTDQSLNIIKRFKKKDHRIKFYQLKKNSKSAAIPRNLGLTKIKGKYVCFIDSDDYWNNKKLELQLKLIDKKKIIFTDCQYIKDNKKSPFFINLFRTITQYLFTKLAAYNSDFFYVYNPIVFSSVMLESKVAKKIIFQEEKELVGIEDLFAWIKLLKNHKLSMVYLPNKLVTVLRKPESLHSDYNKQNIKTISLFAKQYLNNENFKNIKIFLIGIILRALRPILKRFITFINLNYKKIFYFLLLVYFIIFYSPLFWHMGSRLLYYDKNIVLEDQEAVVLFSGPGYISYSSNSYYLRFKDAEKLIQNGYKNKIYILGRLIDIPQQKIIENLLISLGYPQNKIVIVYEDFGNTLLNLTELEKTFKKNNIKNFLLVTGPYHTYRSKIIWNELIKSKIKMTVYKSNDWPVKNNFFEKSYYKKIIIFEFLSLLYNKYLK